MDNVCQPESQATWINLVSQHLILGNIHFHINMGQWGDRRIKKYGRLRQILLIMISESQPGVMKSHM